MTISKRGRHEARANSLQIAAVVATRNRPGYLANRSLASVAAQTRTPDLLVVVDDSDAGVRRVNAEVVADFSAQRARVVYLENYRTPGASGAWNTALAYLQRANPGCFAAVLDDDDAWRPTYLRRCEETALAADADMVAAGLVRYEYSGDPGRLQPAPDRLDADDFLVGNPNIQGSNLFVRLRTLLEAGGFDEAMPSTTDRDLCIRIADLAQTRYTPIPECLVEHYADPDRERLSSRGSAVKREGLRRFYRKHRSRMSEKQRQRFMDRASRLFGYDPAQEERTGSTLTQPVNVANAPANAETPDSEPLDLIVGVITSPDVEIVAGLLSDLADAYVHRDDVTLSVLLLENGGADDAAGNRLANVEDRAGDRGLIVSRISREKQAEDLAAGKFGSRYRKLPDRASIAMARTMLQHYLYQIASEPVRHRRIVWILDDDSRLDSLVLREDGAVVREQPDVVGLLRSISADGASPDVVIGEVTGDPPLPFSSSIRVQLVDLCHNLEALARMKPEDIFPDRKRENALSRATRPDFYYDLSIQGASHLETPFWYQPSADGMTAAQVFAEMVERAPDMLRGIQVFRPLAHASAQNPSLAQLPSANRGPNTFIFDAEALREFPNAAPAIGGLDTRRSDMVWSLLNRFVGGRKVVFAPIPIRQDRSLVKNAALDLRKLAQDVHGYAIYSALRDILLYKAQRRQRQRGGSGYGTELMEFESSDLDRVQELFRKYVTERVNAFDLSCLRIIGLLGAMSKFTQPGEGGAWWLSSENGADAVQTLRALADTMRRSYTDEALDEFRRMAQDYNMKDVRAFYAGLGESVEEYRDSSDERRIGMIARANAVVESEFGAERLRTLGHGAEGVVFTDGESVYKCILDFDFDGSDTQRRLIESLVGRLDGYNALCAISDVRRCGNDLVISYPFEEGKPYRGGRLDDMLAFLRECRAAGIVSRNVHPDNFIVIQGGLKFIDYGRDIMPYSDNEFLHMCRRAFLAWRFHFRSDLKELMRSALTNHNNLPELSGFDHFLAALDPRNASEALDGVLTDMAKETGAESVLDYGCGRGRLARRLASEGFRVTGFDPDPAAAAAWDSQRTEVDFLDADGIHGLLKRERPFDLVVCSRVLCAIHHRQELDEALRNIRRLVAETGIALVAVCNPFSYRIERTEGHERIPNGDARYDSTFSCAERDPTSEEWLSEMHRPLEAYRRALLGAGLSIESVDEIPGSDTLNMRPGSDYMILRLRPVSEAPGVSLLIKTCFMEWRTIERQVRHQVSQLEGPRGFAEKVVVVDQRVGDFTGQYEDADPVAHRHAMKRLLEDGVVDRVIYAPQDTKTIRAALKRWFGVDATASHTASGQPVFAALWGFEQCESEYVLQMDSDLLIGRADSEHDYVHDIQNLFEADPKALFVPLSIAGSSGGAYTFEGSGGDWRVEVRGCMLRKDRVESVLPIRNQVIDGALQTTWHRAFDTFIAGSDCHSYRGGDPRTFFIHVPNDWKKDTDELFGVIDRVEAGFAPAIQNDSAELAGTWSDWSGPKRSEPYLFLICARNLDPGQLKRCVDSVLSQTVSDWGAIVIDDASTNGCGDYARMLLVPHSDRITLVRNTERKGLMRNMREAIFHFCDNPQSVIITLDGDDLLAGPRVLERVEREYDAGADVTVGSMTRLDKEGRYPPDLFDPRGSRGGSVWQHLRTFRKYLFDAIRADDLKLDGEWIEYANDWAYMLPIVEMAANPVHIAESLYVYDPATRAEDYERARDANISRIVARPRYARLCSPSQN